MPDNAHVVAYMAHEHARLHEIMTAHVVASELAPSARNVDERSAASYWAGHMAGRYIQEKRVAEGRA